MSYKTRFSEAGVHLFNRTSGLNILLDELGVPIEQLAQAPRYVSIALTNACGLRCSYCYAPKHPAELDSDRVLGWAAELDASGCLGVGFGGGEPTLHPQFVELCIGITRKTAMAVTFTTHGHRLTAALADALRGSVHFARLSVDGIGTTYERLRGRSFGAVRDAAGRLGSIAPFGINVVVNADTIGELDELEGFAHDVGASELLLLPEQPTAAVPGISRGDTERLVRWIGAARPRMRLAISRSGIDGLPVADPIPGEHPLDAHMHIDAVGLLRPHAYAPAGTPIKDSILDAIGTLREAA